MTPVQLAKTQIVPDRRLATNILHATIFLLQMTTRAVGYLLLLKIPSIVALILLMQQTDAICPVPPEAQQNAQSVKHAMEILLVVVGTPFIVALRGTMHQVNVIYHVHQA